MRKITSIALSFACLSACFTVQDERGHTGPAPRANPDVPTPAPQEPTPETLPPDPSAPVADQAKTPLRCIFEGQRFLDSDDLQTALELELDAWLGGSSIHVVADDCIYQLTQHYLSLGFDSATVQVTAGRDEKGDLLTFSIQEGPQTLIAGFDFPGLTPIPELSAGDLQALYSTEDEPAWIHRKVNALPKKVLEQHRALGFLDVTAGPATVHPLPEQDTEFERFVRIELPTQPGPRYTLAAVRHDLAADLADRIKLQSALDDVQSSSDGLFFPRLVPMWIRAADRALTGAGYLDSEVQAQMEKDSELAQVTVNLTIQPGQQVLLGTIQYPAQLKTRQSFLNQQIRLRPGDPLSAKVMDEALANLYRTGLFRTVNLKVDGSGPVRDLVVELEEWPTRETFIEPGFGSFEGARLHAGWRHHNVLGVGRSVRFEGVLAENASRALIGWSDPWTLGGDWVLDANADVSQRRLPAFTRNSSAAGVFASRTLGDLDRWTVHTGSRFEEIRLTDVRVDHLLGDDIEEDLSITTFEVGLAYDDRNHPLLPSSGQKGHLTVQQTLDVSGSANAFAKVLASWSYYHALSESRVLSIGARTIAVFPKDGNPHPLGLRIFSGGNNSVRSFKEAKLGPLDADGTPVGGEASSTFSLELSQRLGSSAFQAAVFADVGNVVPAAPDLFEFLDLETALGVGMRYVLPIGPMRLDWAHNPNAGEFQDDWVLHFSVGVAF